MKRIVAILSMAAVLLGTSGCALQQSAGDVSNPMQGSFTSDVTLTTKDSETKGTLTRYGNEAWSVVFSEPAALSGVQLDFMDDMVTATYKGLEFSVPQSAQAVRTMLEELMDVVDDIAQEPTLKGTKEEGNLLLKGEEDDTPYTLTVGEDGTPLSFALPGYGLTITFETFSADGSAPAPTAAEETSSSSETQAPTEVETAQ